MQKSASIQPRTSPSKFGGRIQFNIHSSPYPGFRCCWRSTPAGPLGKDSVQKTRHSIFPEKYFDASSQFELRLRVIWFDGMIKHSEPFSERITRPDPEGSGHLNTKAWAFLAAAEEAYQQTGERGFRRISKESPGNDLAVGRSAPGVVEISFRGTQGFKLMFF